MMKGSGSINLVRDGLAYLLLQVGLFLGGVLVVMLSHSTPIRLLAVGVIVWVVAIYLTRSKPSASEQNEGPSDA